MINLKQFDTIEDVEKQLTSNNSDLTSEFVENVFKFFVMEEYMARFGYVLEADTRVFKKRDFSLDDLKYFMKKLEIQLDKGDDIAKIQKTSRQLKLVMECMSAYEKSRKSVKCK